MTEPLEPVDSWAALGTLPHATFVRLCAQLDLNVADRRSTQSHLSAISEANIAWRDVLVLLQRAELKQLCAELGLDTSGKEKAAIVLRLANHESRATQASRAPRDFVTVPYELSPAIRERVRQKYGELKETIEHTHHEYVFARIHRVIARLEGKDSKWLRELASLAGALLDVYCDSSTDGDTRQDLLAALYYLCSPDDVIPDYQPAIGYADDALVLNMCARDVCRVSDTLQRVLSALERQR